MNTPAQSRNPWPIAIVVYFVVFGAFLAGFIVWAMRQREDLASVDYYEREIRYQQQLDAMNRSQTMAAQVIVTFDPAPPAIVITLPVAQSQGAKGRVHLYRPSDARLDRELPLALNAEGIQRLDATQLRDGLWKIRLEWSADGREYFLVQPVIVTSGASVSGPART